MSKKPKTVSTIKGKMLGYTFVIIFFMTVLSIYSLSITGVYKSRIDDMFERNIALDNLSGKLDEVHQELLVYLLTKNSQNLNDYMLSLAELEELAADTAGKINLYTQEDLMVLDIENMIMNYGSLGNQAVEDKRKNDVSAYTKGYHEAQTIKEYIDDLINELNIRQLDTNADTYLYMSDQIARSRLLNGGLIGLLIMFSLLIVFQMTSSMINPIIRLSHSAEAIAAGEFETKSIHVDTNDELEILARAFNKMKKSIHRYIEELKEKAKTEALLKDKEVENLKIQSLLDNARLFALQSQMNPHFLFNTINAGVQLSMMEEATRTGEFLESMSRLLRYNIKQLDKPVTMREEIDNVRDYCELLKVRFGDQIHFNFTLDDSAMEFLIPPLTLQPIVENAYIHGLSKQEKGGRIDIHILNYEGRTTIVIEDNGSGISDLDVSRIMGKGSMKKQEIRANQSNGIGMSNVMQRLELFYQEKDLLTIKGFEGSGTKVTIQVPNINEHEEFGLK